jgi:hypothetical protein
MNGIHVSKTLCTILILFSKDKTHLYKHYNVLKHKYLWLNGKLKDQNKEVLSTITFMEFGIDNTGYGTYIYDRLQYVRHNVKCKCE